MILRPSTRNPVWPAVASIGLVLATLPFLVDTVEWWLHNDFGLVSFSIMMPIVAGAACLVRVRTRGAAAFPPGGEPTRSGVDTAGVAGETAFCSNGSTRLCRGLVLVTLLAIGLSIVGAMVGEPILQSSGLWLASAAVIGWWRGWMAGRRDVLPLFPLVLVAPLTWGWPARLEALLQQVSATFAQCWLDLVGIPVIRYGTILDTPTFRNLVDDTCSGVGTITALLVYTMVLGLVLRVADRAVVVLMVLAVPLGLVVNGARIAWISALGEKGGSELAGGPLHQVTGVVAFGVAYAVVLLVLFLLRRRWMVPSKAQATERPIASGPRK